MEPDQRGRTDTGLEIILVSLALVLSIFSVWLSSWDPLWKWMHITDMELRTSLGSTLSIIFLLSGFLPALLLQNDRLGRRIETRCDEIVRDIATSVPQLHGFQIMDSEESYDYLARNLPHAQRVWNTRLGDSWDTSRYGSASARHYRTALEVAINQGLQFREVISASWAKDAEKIVQATRKRPDHPYSFTVVRDSALPMLNFIVLHYPDNRKEVLAGWLDSRTSRPEQDSMLFRDPRIVGYFQTWWDEIHRTAEPRNSSARSD
ncbi:hypothetical protein GCM10022223_67050 [Kineosporia mesophila]|uniref:Uncharacterized protein n=2 Tax=Kineosporia mesophila TaxID=566012 RepID=A0ABP7ASE0_9ACTN